MVIKGTVICVQPFSPCTLVLVLRHNIVGRLAIEFEAAIFVTVVILRSDELYDIYRTSWNFMGKKSFTLVCNHDLAMINWQIMILNFGTFSN